MPAVSSIILSREGAVCTWILKGVRRGILAVPLRNNSSIGLLKTFDLVAARAHAGEPLGVAKPEGLPAHECGSGDPRELFRVITLKDPPPFFISVVYVFY